MSKTDTTKFIYMGDPQCSRIRGRDNDYSQWGQLLRRALVMQRQDAVESAGEEDAAAEEMLLVLGGDLVNRKDSHAAWDAFFDVTEGIAAPVKMATVVTGSEESTGRYEDRFFNPGNGPACHEKEFFSFDYGCCHFMFLNSDYMGNRTEDAYKYIGAWIKADLAVNRQSVTFAVMHHPVYTVGTSFDDDVRAAAIRENYMKLLYRYGVDMILCGHQHVYARSEAKTDESAGRYEITQIMGVSGTKYFDAWDKSSMACVRENISVATLFETDGEALTCHASRGPERIAFAAEELTLYEGKQQTAAAALQPPTYLAVSYRTEDPGIAAVDGAGRVSALRPGTTALLAETATGLSASCRVTVLPVGIALNRETMKVRVGTALFGKRDRM